MYIVCNYLLFICALSEIRWYSYSTTVVVVVACVRCLGRQIDVVMNGGGWCAGFSLLGLKGFG